MASSKSLRKGQTQIACQLCEISTSIRWKCLDCDLLLCNKCKEHIHTKIRHAEGHKIIDIKDIGSHSSEINVDRITCPSHPAKFCCLYCTCCDVIICPICVSTGHQKHTLSEISVAYDKKLEELQEWESQNEKERKKIIDKQDLIRTQMHRKKDVMKKVKERILGQEKYLITEVQRYSKELCSALERNSDVWLGNLQSDDEAITAWLSTVSKSASEMRSLSSSRDASSFFGKVASIEKPTKGPRLSSFFEDGSLVPQFVPGRISASVFGTLKSKTTTSTPFECDVNVVSKFKTTLRRIGCIASRKLQSVWISSVHDKLLHNIDLTNGVIKIVMSLNLKVCDMAITENGDLLITPTTDFAKHHLLTVKRGSSDLVESAFSVAPLYAMGVKTVPGGKVLVGAVNAEYPDPGERSIVILDKKGRREYEFKLDEYCGQNIEILELTYTKDRHLHAVVATEAKRNAEIIVFDQSSKIVNTYNGQEFNNDFQPFHPTDIVTTKDGNVVVLDSDALTLHILDSVGRYLTHYYTVDSEIYYPFSLDVTESGAVTIGCASPSEDKNEALLYVVELPY